MAIVEFINKPNRSYQGMRNVINYVLDDEKTLDNLISGIGVNPTNAYDEFCTMKQIMAKTDKRLWYHFVQSFPPYDNATPEIAMEVAHKLVDYFKDEYQILIAVHQDKDHLHAHFILNTVNMVTGKKYTQNKYQMKEIQALSDRVCEEYGLHTLSEGQRNTGTYKKSGEYRAELNGTSWKSDLKFAIDTALQYAKSKNEFIKLMNSQGYKVRWEENRTNITFTTPSGMKCRDRKLGNDDYYNKDNFEKIFDFNANLSNDDLPIAFDILDNINAIIGGNASDFQIMQFSNVDIEGLSFEDIQLLFKRLRDEREFAKCMEELKQRNKQAAANMNELWGNIEGALRWFAEYQNSQHQNDFASYDNER